MAATDREEIEAREAIRTALVAYKAILRAKLHGTVEDAIDRDVSIAEVEAAGRVLHFESPGV